MNRAVFKIIMFISSYFPLYIMLLILHFDRCKSFDSWKKIVFIVAIVFCIFVSVLSVLSLKGTSTKSIAIAFLERPDDTVISYMMTYVIPLITTNFSHKNELIINMILFLLTGYLYIRLNLIYLNPLWSMVGFLTYRVNNNGILITNIPYNSLRESEKIGQKLKGYYIANDVFIANNKNNQPQAPS